MSKKKIDKLRAKKREYQRELRELFEAKRVLKKNKNLPTEIKLKIFRDYYGGINRERELKNLITDIEDEILDLGEGVFSINARDLR